MKIFALFLFLIICYLGYDIYKGRNGIEQYNRISQKYEEAEEKSKKLEARNQALEDEISDLQQGNLVVEEIARSELGMVKKNETFFRVIEKDEQKGSNSK
ncbi:MAG: septum formation initiator family protein [Succinivibrio sp.]